MPSITLIFAALYALVFYAGAAVFSFINVVVYRLPRGQNYVSGRSACPHCGAALKWYHNLPLFSFLVLGGKCAFCKGKIAARYLLMELLGGALSVFTWAFYVDPYQLDYSAPLAYLLVFVLLCVLAAVAFIDRDTLEIPNGLCIWIAALGLVSIALFPQITLLERGIGLICVSLPLFLLTLVIDGAFGGGDIKLMAAAGIFLGWKLSLVALFIALILGGAYGAYLLAFKKKGKKDHLAFGPFLSAGIALAWFFGTPALKLYLGFFGL